MTDLFNFIPLLQRVVGSVLMIPVSGTTLTFQASSVLSTLYMVMEARSASSLATQGARYELVLRYPSQLSKHLCSIANTLHPCSRNSHRSLVSTARLILLNSGSMRLSDPLAVSAMTQLTTFPVN